MKKLIVSVALAGLLIGCAPAEVGGREPVYIGQSEIIAQLSAPPTITLNIQGDLPTACHEFHSEVEGPDAENRIHVTVYSTVNPTMRCAQVLQPFNESLVIPMGGQAEGIYTIYLNGSPVGEFNYVTQ
jgi:hypothetical protein